MFSASDQSFVNRVMQLIEKRTGLSANAQRAADLEFWLHRLSGDNPLAFWRQLNDSDTASQEWQLLLNALTIGETYFLRDKDHFKYLRDHILPDIIVRRRRQQNLDISVWSVGCSTGEEPYSVATTLYEFIPDIADWTVTIMGTDINERSVEFGRRAEYREWSFRHTPESFRKRYFDPLPTGSKLRPHIREMVTLQRGNLFDITPQPRFDIIFCRNVLLYFAKERITNAEDILYQALRPGGWLIMGQAEALHAERERWTLHIFPGTPIYQKPVQPTQAGQSIRYEPELKPTGILRIDKNDAKQVDEEYIAAVEAIYDDQHQEAEQYLADILAMQPKHARAHTLLAYIFANRHAYPEARTHIEEALKLNPLLADAHYIQALIALEKDDHKAAQQSLQSALYCERDHVLAAYTLGSLLAKNGDTAKAQRQWQHALDTLQAYPNPAQHVSDISDFTVETLITLIQQHLKEDEPAISNKPSSSQVSRE